MGPVLAKDDPCAGVQGLITTTRHRESSLVLLYLVRGRKG